MQRWPRNVKDSIILMTWCFSSGSCSRDRQPPSVLAHNVRGTYPANEVLENLDLDKSLVMEPLLVPDDLDRDHVSRLVIAALQNLTERALAEDVDDFVAVLYVIVRDHEIVAPLVVVAVIAGRVLLRRRLLLAVRSDEVDLAVLADLVSLERREIPRVQRTGFLGAERGQRLRRFRELEKPAYRIRVHPGGETLRALTSSIRRHLFVASDLVLVGKDPARSGRTPRFGHRRTESRARTSAGRSESSSDRRLGRQGAA